MSVDCVATEGHPDVHELGCCLKLYWCSWALQPGAILVWVAWVASWSLVYICGFCCHQGSGGSGWPVLPSEVMPRDGRSTEPCDGVRDLCSGSDPWSVLPLETMLRSSVHADILNNKTQRKRARHGMWLLTLKLCSFWHNSSRKEYSSQHCHQLGMKYLNAQVCRWHLMQITTFNQVSLYRIQKIYHYHLEQNW